MGENDENEVADQAAKPAGYRPNRDESNIPVPILQRIGHPAYANDECDAAEPKKWSENLRGWGERWRTIIELLFGTLTFILTVFLAGATVFLALDNRKLVTDTASSVVEMRTANAAATRANDIASAALAANQRPWVSLSLVEHGDLRIENDEARIVLVFRAKNFGSTPAVRAQIRSGAEVRFDEGQRRATAQRELEASMASLIGHGFATEVIYPGEEKEFAIEAYLSPASFGKFRDWFQQAHGQDADRFYFDVFGILQYEGIGEPCAYLTGFSYAVNETDPARTQALKAFKIRDGVVPAENIHMSRLTDEPVFESKCDDKR